MYACTTPTVSEEGKGSSWRERSPCTFWIVRINDHAVAALVHARQVQVLRIQRVPPESALVNAACSSPTFPPAAITSPCVIFVNFMLRDSRHSLSLSLERTILRGAAAAACRGSATVVSVIFPVENSWYQTHKPTVEHVTRPLHVAVSPGPQEFKFHPVPVPGLWAWVK
eukprot:1122142-Rhodomonas_salina.1